MHSSKLTIVLKYWVHLMNIPRKKKKIKNFKLKIQGIFI